VGETAARAIVDAFVFLAVMLPVEAVVAAAGMRDKAARILRSAFLCLPAILAIFLPPGFPGMTGLDAGPAVLALSGFAGGFLDGLPALATALAAAALRGGDSAVWAMIALALAFAWIAGAAASPGRRAAGAPELLIRILSLSLASAIGTAALAWSASGNGGGAAEIGLVPLAGLYGFAVVAASGTGYAFPSLALRRVAIRAAMLESARDAFLLVAGGRIVDANARARSLLQAEGEALAGVDPGAISAVLAPDSAPMARAASGEFFSMDGECRSLDGRAFSAELSFSPTRSAPSGSVGIFARDVSLRRSEEDLIAVSERIFDESSESIVVTDSGGTITYVNQAFAELTGYRREELVGRSPRVLRSGRHDAPFYEAMWKAIREEGHWAGEIWNRKKGGEVCPCEERIIAYRGDGEAAARYVGLLRDVSELSRSKDELAFRRNRDSLTGFHNREGFMGILDRDLSGIGARRRLVLLALDIAGFRSINQGYGHRAGDGILEEFANRLRSVARPGLEFARLGGDVFLVELIDSGEGYSVYSLWEALKGCFDRPFPLPGGEIAMAMCLGIATAKPGDTGIQLLKRSEIALEHAKQRGKGAYAFYQEGMERRAVDRLLISRKLKEAIDQGLVAVHYQPKVDLKTGLVSGLEALARWKDPELGPVSPGSFIPLAEETGLIVPLGQRVLETVLADLGELHAKRRLTVAVNLSVKQFRNAGLVDEISRMVGEASVPPEALELEITESVFIDDLEEVAEICRGLKSRGCSLALDDFGTGYSSLTYLSHLPFDTLKLDKGFVVDIERDARRRAMLDAIVSLSKALGIKTVVEGIEAMEQETLLSDLGCDYGQGFLYSEALPLAEVLEFIDKRGILPD